MVVGIGKQHKKTNASVLQKKTSRVVKRKRVTTKSYFPWIFDISALATIIMSYVSYQRYVYWISKAKPALQIQMVQWLEREHKGADVYAELVVSGNWQKIDMSPFHALTPVAWHHILAHSRSQNLATYLQSSTCDSYIALRFWLTQKLISYRASIIKYVFTCVPWPTSERLCVLVRTFDKTHVVARPWMQHIPLLFPEWPTGIFNPMTTEGLEILQVLFREKCINEDNVVSFMFDDTVSQEMQIRCFQAACNLKLFKALLHFWQPHIKLRELGPWPPRGYSQSRRSFNYLFSLASWQLPMSLNDAIDELKTDFDVMPIHELQKKFRLHLPDLAFISQAIWDAGRKRQCESILREEALNIKYIRSAESWEFFFTILHHEIRANPLRWLRLSFQGTDLFLFHKLRDLVTNEVLFEQGLCCELSYPCLQSIWQNSNEWIHAAPAIFENAIKKKNFKTAEFLAQQEDVILDNRFLCQHLLDLTQRYAIHSISKITNATAVDVSLKKQAFQCVIYNTNLQVFTALWKIIPLKNEGVFFQDVLQKWNTLFGWKSIVKIYQVLLNDGAISSQQIFDALADSNMPSNYKHRIGYVLGCF